MIPQINHEELRMADGGKVALLVEALQKLKASLGEGAEKWTPDLRNRLQTIADTHDVPVSKAGEEFQKIQIKPMADPRVVQRAQLPEEQFPLISKILRERSRMDEPSTFLSTNTDLPSNVREQLNIGYLKALSQQMNAMEQPSNSALAQLRQAVDQYRTQLSPYWKPGMADGGQVDSPSMLSKLADLARNFGGPENREARAHLIEGLAGQLYGLDKSGKPAFLGGLDSDPNPGVVDEILEIPTLLSVLGIDPPEVSKQAEANLAKLHEKLRAEMHLQEPHGLTENLASAAGSMLGQIPLGGGALSEAAEEGPSALSILKKAASAPIEWLGPTIHPSLGNYLSGTLFGGGVGALSDAVSSRRSSPPVPEEAGLLPNRVK